MVTFDSGLLHGSCDALISKGSLPGLKPKKVCQICAKACRKQQDFIVSIEYLETPKGGQALL